MSIAAKVTGLLGGVWNLFSLGGTNGGIAIRQKNGISGTNEGRIYHDGSVLNVTTPNGGGSIVLQTGSGGAGLQILSNGIISLPSSNIQDSGAFSWSIATGLFLNRSSGQFGWSNATASIGGTPDTGLARVVAGVIKPTDGSGGVGWLQNSAGRARLTANVTNATATLASLTDLTITLIAGRKYFGSIVLKCNDSVAAEGIKFDFNGGAATMTSFWAAAGVIAGGVVVSGTTISTSLAGALDWSTITGETVITINFSLVCNAGGTFIPRFAQDSHSSGTATVELGSFIFVEDCP